MSFHKFTAPQAQNQDPLLVGLKNTNAQRAPSGISPNVVCGELQNSVMFIQDTVVTKNCCFSLIQMPTQQVTSAEAPVAMAMTFSWTGAFFFSGKLLFSVYLFCYRLRIELWSTLGKLIAVGRLNCEHVFDDSHVKGQRCFADCGGNVAVFQR